MVRTTKQSSATVAPTPAPAVVSADDAVAASASATKKPRKPKAEVVVAPVVVAPTNEVVSAEPVAVATDATSVSIKMTEFSAKLQQIVSLLSSAKGEFKLLEKIVSRDLKNAQKSSSKKGKRSGNRQPSGFVKPTRISDELATFLGKSSGTEMARTSVSKEINAYIRENNLQDKTNGRKIIPDARLTQLLKITAEDELTYFNLQKYMKHHFVKAEVAAAAAV